MTPKYSVGDKIKIQREEDWAICQIIEVTADQYKAKQLDSTARWAFYIGEERTIPFESVDDDPAIALLMQAPQVQVNIQKRFCACEMLTLMRTGCACGGT